jgi:predicted MPP superfamily phosphohydrolase
MPIGRRAALKVLAGAGTVAVGGGTPYLYLHATHQLQVTRVSLPVPRLPTSLAGLRIGLITDVHRSRWVSQETVAHAAGVLMQERPDLIVLGGDYVTWGERQYVPAAAEALATLSAPLGVYGILGNHDDDHDMPAALAARGVQMLKDTRTALRIRGEPVTMIGIRFWTKRASDIASIVRGATGFRILLAHDPRRLNEAAGLHIPLVLSGHTHGGQVVLPAVGAIAAQKFPIVSGVGRRDQTTIFVSRGVGMVYVPIRVNCPPEVAVLTLAAQ